MRRLALYPDTPTTAVERELPLDRDALTDIPSGGSQRGKRCVRCDLERRARHVCIPDDGEPGGLLVIGEGPGADEDLRGRNFIGKSGKMLRRYLEKNWAGPVAFSNATRCFPGQELEAKHVDACRGYLTQTFAEVKPTRVITLGNWAAQAVTGRSHAVLSNRRTYSYIYNEDPPVPVFHLVHPAAALRNRFVEIWWYEDLQWALKCADPMVAPIGATFFLVETEEDAKYAAAALRAAGRVTFDCETAGDMHDLTFRLLCVGLCGPSGKPSFAWDSKALANPRVVAPLRELLEDPAVEKVGQNVKYDIRSVHLGLGIRVRGVVGDSRLWHKLLESDADASLDRMSELVGMGGTKEDQEAAMLPLVEKIKSGLDTEKNLLPRRALQPNKKWPKLHYKRVEGLAALAWLDEHDPELAKMARTKGTARWRGWAYALAPPEVLVPYCVRDAVATARVCEREEPRLREVPELDRVRRLIVDKAAYTVARVEEWGVQVDMTCLRAFDVELAFKLDAVAQQVFEYAPPGFNPDSVPQLRELLFNTLHLPIIKLTDNEIDPSTDRDVLEALEHHHPVVKQIIEWRRLKKLRGTYASGMIPHVRSDGRVHTSLLPDGARSGRWSSKHPNIQNLPRVKDDKGHTEGKTARSVFIAPPGWTLWSFDYSQIELRVAALLSGDPVMIELFKDPTIDFHLSTAKSIARTAWGIAPEDVQKEHRYAAKTVVFSSLYGAGDESVAKKCKVSREDARRIREAIFGKLVRLNSWCQDQLRQAQRTGHCWTWWGGQRARRRSLWRLADHDEMARSRAEHGSWNTPIQGTASDFNTASLCAAIEWIEREQLEDRVHLILPIHDQLVFEVRDDYGDKIVDPIRQIMTSWDAGDVPIVVDVECGPSLGELSPWSPKP